MSAPFSLRGSCCRRSTLAFLGMMCMMGPYWSLATSFLSGAAAAGGIALINTIANAGGVLSPYVMGWLKDVHRSLHGGPGHAGADHAHRQRAGPLHPA